MEPKNSKIFKKEIMQAVSAFCESQEIKDVDQFMYLCFKQGFDIKRYGFLGKTLNEGEKYLNTDNEGEKDLSDSRKMGGEQEKRVEIPVEVIKEVEKIIEVPVEKEVIKEIIKEVPVEKVVIQEVIKEVPIDRIIEKEVYITDNTQVNELLLKIQQLENEMSKKDEELDGLRRKISIKDGEVNQLRQEFSTKTTEMENIFQNEMSKKDEELAELSRTLDELLDKPPVEVIKEIEKIVEDPVTNNKLNMLQETLQNLRGDLQLKNEQIKELEKINRELINSNQNQGYLMKGSNLNRRI